MTSITSRASRCQRGGVLTARSGPSPVDGPAAAPPPTGGPTRPVDGGSAGGRATAGFLTSTTTEVCGAADGDRPVGCRVEGAGAARARGRDAAPLVASATADIREAAAPISDPGDAELARLRHRTDNFLLVLAEGASLIGGALARLRDPRSGTWRGELVARGRFRRWARWQVPGEQAAAAVLATVTADVTAGRVPDPVGAALVEVVDHRPPARPRVAP